MNFRVASRILYILGLVFFAFGMYAVFFHSRSWMDKLSGSHQSHALKYILIGATSILIGFLLRLKRHKRK